MPPSSLMAAANAFKKKQTNFVPVNTQKKSSESISGLENALGAASRRHAWLDLPVAGSAQMSVDVMKDEAKPVVLSDGPLKKKQRVQHVVMQPLNTHSGATPGTQLYTIVKHLENHRKPISLSELSILLSLPGLEHNTALITALKAEPRVKHLPKMDLYEHRPEFEIKTAAEMWDILVDRFENASSAIEGGAGVQHKMLTNSWSGAAVQLDLWEEEGKVVILKGGRERFVFPNLLPKPEIDEEFKTSWHALLLPISASDIQAELKKFGIKTTESTGGPGVAQPTLKKAKKKRQQKITKFSNDHVQGVDLNSFYTPPTA